VFAENPMSTSRYRDRHSTSGAKSDLGDAKVLADMVRTDRHNHRPVSADSEQVQAVKILARAHQSTIWSRGRQTNLLRSTRREFYPAALAAFDDLTSTDPLEVLRVAPIPELGRGLSNSKIAAALRRGGRRRRVDERAAEIQAALRAPQLAAPAAISTAMGASVSASVAVITAMVAQTAVLAVELEAGFEAHPDAEVVRSLPGLGTVLGARVLGEFGDEPNRYGTAKSRKNYAGTSPITRASGTKRVVLARYARNQRLADAIYLWAFAALTASPGARAFYDTRRTAGDTHHAALRARHPPRLPRTPHHLRRNSRLGPPPRKTSRRRLTSWSRGMSRAAPGLDELGDPKPTVGHSPRDAAGMRRGQRHLVVHTGDLGQGLSGRRHAKGGCRLVLRRLRRLGQQRGSRGLQLLTHGCRSCLRAAGGPALALRIVWSSKAPVATF
jgi:hypothetical protein